MSKNISDDYDFDKAMGAPPSIAVQDRKAAVEPKPDDKKDEPDLTKTDDKKDDDKDDDDLKDFKFDLDDDDDKKPEDKKPTKKTKEESLAELRKQRDSLNEEVVKYKDVVGEADLGIVKQIKSFIDESFKDDIPTENSVIAFLDDARQLKKENEKLLEELKNRDVKIKDLDIRSSAEFNDQYIKPLQASASDLQVEIANLDSSGNVLAPESTRSFHTYLMKQEKMDSLQMKQLLAKFAADFEKETGEKYQAPSVAAVMSSFRLFKTNDEKMGAAYREWETQKKLSIDKKNQLTQEQLKMQDKNNRDERKAGAIKALRSFDLEQLEGLQTKEELESTVRSVYQEMEGIIQDHTKLPTYDITMQRAVKATLYDQVIKEYNELLQWKKSQEEEDGDTSKDRGSRKVKDDGSDWLDGDF